MLTRCLFTLLAALALAGLLPGVDPSSEPLRKLLLAEICLLCTGMAAPWGSWMPFVSPGLNLAFVTKLLGWGGACGLPFCLVSGLWLAAGICALLPVCAFALWKGRAWAAWPWYAIAVGAFWISLTSAYQAFLIPIWIGPIDPYEEVTGRILTYGIVGVWVLFWGGIGLVLTREVTSWRRGLQAVRGPTPAS
jgi:hypothetical protein